MEQSANDFFIEYQRANSSSDVSAIGALYADTFVFGGISGSQAVNKTDFLKRIPKWKAYYASVGLSAAKLGSVEEVPIGSRYLLATVAWRFRLQNSADVKDFEALSTYVLARTAGDALSILLQIDHQDLASIIKEQPTL